MKRCISSFLFTVAMAVPAFSAPVAFNISGSLSDEGLTLNDAFDNAVFQGTVVVDTISVKANISSAITYNLLSYYVVVTPVGAAPSFSFLGDGEAGEGDSGASVQKNDGILFFVLYENIDDPATAAIERRQLQLSFNGNTTAPVSSLAGLIAAAPDVGSNFDAGLLQVSTSQLPTAVEDAEATVLERDTPPISPVPVPASVGLLVAGLIGFGSVGFGRRRTSKRARPNLL